MDSTAFVSVMKRESGKNARLHRMNGPAGQFKIGPQINIVCISVIYFMC